MSSSASARWPAPPQALRALVRRLPIRPPSQALALALNRLLRPRLGEAERALLSHRVVEIAVSDLGLRCRLRLDEHGFHPAPDGGETSLRIVADAASYLRLMRGRDDADRLFFERALVMEGDTEYGLLLKNTLDALGPLWPPR